MTCQPLRGPDEVCESDFQCKNDNFCGYKTEADKRAAKKTCLKLFSQEVGTAFGADKTMESEEEQALHNGQYCQSGFARVRLDAAVCVNVTSIRTNMDNYVKDQSMLEKDKYVAPVCKLDSFTDSACQYFAVSSQNAVPAKLMENHCQCSLAKKQDTGFCQFPHQKFMVENFIPAWLELRRSSKCHTLDRDDLYAQKDCGAVTSA